MTARMTKEAEARILRGVEQVVDLVDAGWDPDDALVKAAADGDFPPGQVRLIAQAYNTGRANHQRKTAADLFGKTADFPVADAQKALDVLYPDTVKTAAARARDAVSDDYRRPPDLRGGPSKAALAPPPPPRAAPYPRDPGRHAKRAFALLRDLDRERDDRRAAAAHARDKVAAALTALDDHFRLAGHEPFPLVRTQATLLWGWSANAVMAKVAEANPRLLKEEATWDEASAPVARGRGAYHLLGACLDAAREHGRLDTEYREFAKQAGAAASRLLGEFRPPTPPGRPPTLTGSLLAPTPPPEKRGLFEIPQAVLTADLTRAVAGKATALPDAAGALAGLNDPSHEARLRKVRTQAVLHGLLANDEFLSAEHPEKVTGVFNQISQLAPRAAEQPMLMQALLRRYLAQGQVDPHDLDQLVGIETKLKDQAKPDVAGFQLSSVPGGGFKPPEARS